MALPRKLADVMQRALDDYDRICMLVIYLHLYFVKIILIKNPKSRLHF